MKLSLIIFFCIALIGCKNSEQNQSKAATQEPALTLISEYTPNPDEVILFLTTVEKVQTDKGWENKVEVKRQLRSGFGYKNRLSPGQQITLFSSSEIPDGDFYCASDYSVGPGEGTYRLKSLLRNN